MAKQQNKKTSGFTLIELMIVVAILGILAALAIPAFSNYIKKSKTTETSLILGKIYDRAAEMYSTQYIDPAGLLSVSNCIPTAAGLPNPVAAPSSQKAPFVMTIAGWSDLGFEVAAPVLYQYSFAVTPSGATAFVDATAARNLQCGNDPGATDLYVFLANGDLDEDTNLSTFRMNVNTDGENRLTKAAGIYFANELE